VVRVSPIVPFSVLIPNHLSGSNNHIGYKPNIFIPRRYKFENYGFGDLAWPNWKALPKVNRPPILKIATDVKPFQ